MIDSVLVLWGFTGERCHGVSDIWRLLRPASLVVVRAQVEIVQYSTVAAVSSQSRRDRIGEAAMWLLASSVHTWDLGGLLFGRSMYTSRTPPWFPPPVDQIEIARFGTELLRLFREIISHFVRTA